VTESVVSTQFTPFADAFASAALQVAASAAAAAPSAASRLPASPFVAKFAHALSACLQ
jgi:hypothetical protein